MYKIQNFEIIEATIPQNSTATRFYFPDQPQLRFVSLLNLELYTSSTSSFSILSGNPLLDNADLQTTYLVLYANDKESINRIPVFALNNINDTSTPFAFDLKPFAGQQIVWSKSYITTPVAYSNISTSAYACSFGVYYA
jgi:hypothetical protein